MIRRLEELFTEEFLPECRYARKVSDVSIRGYKSAFELFEKIMPEVIYPDNITKNGMVDFFKKLDTRKRIVGKGREKIGVKKSTVATYWSKLNSFFTWLKKNEHINYNPLKEMEYPRVDYLDRKFLQKKQVERIFNALDFVIHWKNDFIRKRNILMFTILLTCGLRKGELLGLKNRDIDLERRYLTIRAETSKSRMQRVLPLNTLAISKIKDYFNDKRKMGVDSEYLFVSDDRSSGLGYDGIKHLVEKVKEVSGINFHLHQFRHTFAVNLLMAKTDILKLKQLLGHRDIRMTAAYVRCLPTEEMRDDVEALSIDNLI
jgi:site-specific recombinase XerD